MGKKYLSTLLLAILFSLGLSVMAFAAGKEPRVPLCTECGGKTGTVVREEAFSIEKPCSHSEFDGYFDKLSKLYENTYYECEECGWGMLLDSVDLGLSYRYCSYIDDFY